MCGRLAGQPCSKGWDLWLEVQLVADYSWCSSEEELTRGQNCLMALLTPRMIECTLSNSANHKKLEVGCMESCQYWEGRAAIQKDISSLEKWNVRSFMKFSTSKGKKSCACAGLISCSSTGWIGNIFPLKDLGVSFKKSENESAVCPCWEESQLYTGFF